MKTETKFFLEEVDVYTAYRGKDGCACGCGGNYFEPEEKGLASIVRKINSNIDQTEIFKGMKNEVIFELTYGQNSVVRAYVNTDELTKQLQDQLLEMAK